MTNENTLQNLETGSLDFLAALATRMPRVLTVTTIVVVATFVAIQFMPQTFEARLSIPASGEVVALDSQTALAEIISRLPADVVAELRDTAGGIQDTTLLLQNRLDAATHDDQLVLAARAGNPTRARAIITAASAVYLESAPMPPSLAGGASTNSGGSAAGPSSIGELQERLSLAWEERVRLESRAKHIETLTANGNFSMLALDTEGLPGLGQKLSQLVELTAERDRLAVDLLPNHPKMRTVMSELASLSTELSTEARALSALVARERDAARQREETLRQDVAAASAAAALAGTDNGIVTGAIDNDTAVDVIALPRPVRTDLALAMTGGLALFAQLGLFARGRSRRGFAIDDPTAIEAEMQQAAPTDLPIAEPFPGDAPERGAASADPATDLDQASFVLVTSNGTIASGTRRLLARYHDQELSVVLVDAASRQCGRAPGVSDLSLGFASFADIVHGSGRDRAALVPWGRQNRLDMSARPVAILLDALSALYDVVVVLVDESDAEALPRLVERADVVIDAEALAPARAAA
jgi:hypothetical protein